MLPATVELDTSGLSRYIAELAPFMRRSLREQCVTSMGVILLAAQRDTPVVPTFLIDAELQVQVTGWTSGGKRGIPRLSRAKNPHSKRVNVRDDARPALGVLVIMARGRPGSNYNVLTGNRWALTRPAAGPGYRQRIGKFVTDSLSRKVKSRHSSTNLLQHSWANPIQIVLSSPFFVGWKTRGINATRALPGNTHNPAQFGTAIIDLIGDDCLVTENALGNGSNAALDESRQRAVREHLVPAAQRAIDDETRVVMARLEEALTSGLKRQFPQLTG